LVLLTRNAKRLGNVRDDMPSAFKMAWRRIACGCVGGRAGTKFLLTMPSFLNDVVDAIGIAVDEFQCYARRNVEVDRVTLAAFQCADVETGDIRLFGARCILQGIAPPQAAVCLVF
jgi:hypothetical protein